MIEKYMLLHDDYILIGIIILSILGYIISFQIWYFTLSISEKSTEEEIFYSSIINSLIWPVFLIVGIFLLFCRFLTLPTIIVLGIYRFFGREKTIEEKKRMLEKLTKELAGK